MKPTALYLFQTMARRKHEVLYLLCSSGVFIRALLFHICWQVLWQRDASWLLGVVTTTWRCGRTTSKALQGKKTRSMPPRERLPYVVRLSTECMDGVGNGDGDRDGDGQTHPLLYCYLRARTDTNNWAVSYSRTCRCCSCHHSRGIELPSFWPDR